MPFLVILELDPGIHLQLKSWIPAYAGMMNTVLSLNDESRKHLQHRRR